MKARAAELRREATHPEHILWQRLRHSQLGGLKFRRQHVIGPYIVDFCCPARNLVIEVDGESHVGRGAIDAERDASLRSRGMIVIRVTNDDVLHDLDAVCEFIVRAAERRGGDRSESRDSPTP
jgi:very-short-patch-repair endonuclease